MNELIKITEHDGKKAVSARVLYEFLEATERFSSWSKRMFKYGFIENVDYVGCKEFNTLANQEITDYALTIECAKEISMLQRSEKGKQARQYFIECEKQLQQSIQPLSQLEILQQSVQMLVAQEKRIESVEKEVKLIRAQTTTRPDCFTVAGYGTLQGIKVPLSFASRIGTYAAKRCRQMGIMMGECSDQRFGGVRTYPSEILDEAFRMATN